MVVMENKQKIEKSYLHYLSYTTSSKSISILFSGRSFPRGASDYSHLPLEEFSSHLVLLAIVSLLSELWRKGTAVQFSKGYYYIISILIYLFYIYSQNLPLQLSSQAIILSLLANHYLILSLGLYPLYFSTSTFQ